MADQTKQPITQVVIHMYKMGTGDCFVLKFMAKQEIRCKMLIDCGCWTRKGAEIKPFIEALKKDVDGHIDVLVVTHEHTDHVLGFEAGREIFINQIKIDQIWMGWPEKDSDGKVKQWKDEHGEKKKKLGLAAKMLHKEVNSAGFEQQFKGSRHAAESLGIHQNFARVLADFADLHVSGGEYVGSLKGMAVVKDEIAKDNIKYHNPGDILENLPGLDGIRIFVLGPPQLWAQVKDESGKGDEAYQHNDQLDDSDLFVQALGNMETPGLEPDEKLIPFSKAYVSEEHKHQASYKDKSQTWRRIDHDWLFSSGAFALRINSLTNNLSLALAFEFTQNNKVMLFPGDAEIGSWKSWHNIKWKDKGVKTTTKKLLNQVVFYKVAHHLSHNGTARSIGLDMMTNTELVAMATLDYQVISDGWKSTMPNRLIVHDLLEKTKGRTIIMNEQDLFYDLDNQVPLFGKISEYRAQMSQAEKDAFKQAYTDTKFYAEYILTV